MTVINDTTVIRLERVAARTGHQHSGDRPIFETVTGEIVTSSFVVSLGGGSLITLQRGPANGLTKEGSILNAAFEDIGGVAGGQTTSVSFDSEDAGASAAAIFITEKDYTTTLTTAGDYAINYKTFQIKTYSPASTTPGFRIIIDYVWAPVREYLKFDPESLLPKLAAFGTGPHAGGSGGSTSADQVSYDGTDNNVATGSTVQEALDQIDGYLPATLQTVYDNTPDRTLFEHNGQLVFRRTQASGAVLQLQNTSSVTPALLIDQGGSGAAAFFKTTDLVSPTISLQNDTINRNANSTTILIDRSTSAVNGGQNGIGSATLTRLENSGANLFNASKISTIATTATDSAEDTKLTIELMQDGVFGEAFSLADGGSVTLPSMTAPPAPSSGGKFYVNSTDGYAYFVDNQNRHFNLITGLDLNAINITRYIDFDIGGGLKNGLVKNSDTFGIPCAEFLKRTGQNPEIKYNLSVPRDWIFGTNMMLTINWSKETADAGNVNWSVNYKSYQSGDNISTLTNHSSNYIQSINSSSNISKTTGNNLLIQGSYIVGNGVLSVSIKRENDSFDTLASSVKISSIRIEYTGRGVL